MHGAGVVSGEAVSVVSGGSGALSPSPFTVWEAIRRQWRKRSPVARTVRSRMSSTIIDSCSAKISSNPTRTFNNSSTFAVPINPAR